MTPLTFGPMEAVLDKECSDKCVCGHPRHSAAASPQCGSRHAKRGKLHSHFGFSFLLGDIWSHIFISRSDSSLANLSLLKIIIWMSHLNLEPSEIRLSSRQLEMRSGGKNKSLQHMFEQNCVGSESVWFVPENPNLTVLRASLRRREHNKQLKYFLGMVVSLIDLIKKYFWHVGYNQCWWRVTWQSLSNE